MATSIVFSRFPGNSSPAGAILIAAPLDVPRSYVPPVFPNSTGSLPNFKSSIKYLVVGPAFLG